MSTTAISPHELAEVLSRDEKVNLIDVRTPAEFREVHLTFARNVPLDRLDPAALKKEGLGQVDKPLYLICRSGGRGQRACELLAAQGFTNLCNIAGGTAACEQAGLPVVRGKKAISLERQVRIAAGSLVLLGVILAWFVNPLLLWISVFVGAGLIFAGVTDTCGMAMLLARMPWNRETT